MIRFSSGPRVRRSWLRLTRSGAGIVFLLLDYFQNVIAEMRNSLAEARGAANRKRNSMAGTQQTEKTGKPPVPPTKAAAVAKIRETIAQAKRESDKELSLTGNQRHSVGY